jgi:hypothetical protein
MRKQIELVCEPEFATDLIMNLMAVDGVDVRMGNKASASFVEAHEAEREEHEMHSMGPLELTTILLNVTGTIASLASIANVLLDRRVKKARLKAEHPQKVREIPAGDAHAIPLSNFKTAEELADFLKERLG